MKAWREASSFSLATTSNTILAIVTEAVKKATSACVIGEHFADAIAGVVREHRVRLLVVRERDQASPQRPAATAGPCRVVDVHLGAKDVPGAGGEQVPGHHEIARRITHAEPSPVDDAGERSAFDEQVPRHEVSVYPQERPGPGGRPKSCVPRPGGRVGVDGSLQGDERGASPIVPTVQRRCAATRRWTAWETEPVQRPDEAREVSRKQIRVGACANGRVLAFEPWVDAPLPWVP